MNTDKLNWWYVILSEDETKLIHMCGYVKKPTDTEYQVFRKEIKEDFLSVKKKSEGKTTKLFLISRETDNDFIEECLTVSKKQPSYQSIPTERMKWN